MEAMLLNTAAIPKHITTWTRWCPLQEDRLVRVNHTDPWVRNDSFRTTRTTGFQTTRSSGNAIHGRAADDVLSREGKSAYIIQAMKSCIHYPASNNPLSFLTNP